MKTTVPVLSPLPAERLQFTDDGHADPEQLLTLMTDADARRASTGLAFLAEHTRTADLTPASTGPRLDPLESALLAAWNASEPEMPECYLCGQQTGPWVPDPPGGRWPSGAQKLVCASGGCQGGADTAVVAPRTWTFTDRATGEVTAVTCMPGCVEDHGGENFAADICCYTSDGKAATLPIDDGAVEDRRVLGVGIRCTPYGGPMAARVPHAVVELVEDRYIEDLDPDGLAVLIDTLQDRVEALRAAHAELVSVRAGYMAAAFREAADANRAADVPRFRRCLNAVEALAAGNPGAVIEGAHALRDVAR